MNSISILDSSDLDVFAKTSKDTVGLIQIGNAYWKWAHALSIPLIRVFTGTLTLVFAYPIVYFFLMFLNRRLQKNCKEPVIGVENYKKIRSTYNRLQEPVNILKSINFPSSKKIPWFFRPLYNQVLKSVRTITGYYNALNCQFDRFDAPIAPLRSGMRMLKGTELYQDNLKSYDYLI